MKQIAYRSTSISNGSFRNRKEEVEEKTYLDAIVGKWNRIVEIMEKEYSTCTRQIHLNLRNRNDIENCPDV